MAAFRSDKVIRTRKPKLVVFAVSIIGVVFVLLASAVGWYVVQTQPVSDSQVETLIIVPEGATPDEIGKLLKERGIIKSAYAFQVYLRINSSTESLQAGTYVMTPSDTLAKIVDKISTGIVAQEFITILPAQRLDQIKTTFAASGYSLEEISRAFEPSQYASHPALVDKPLDASLEGYLYPETYSRTLQTSLNDIITTALDETAERLTPELKSAFAARKLTVHEAVILASIVEREVNNDADRKKVAQVFLKRYQEGIMLGSDPTALYGALKAGIEPSVFADTPYNTRLYVGLPPGPINTVSSSSLEAIANPAATDFLFFVSGDDGNTYFSRTLDEHEALTAQHCIELCKSY